MFVPGAESSTNDVYRLDYQHDFRKIVYLYIIMHLLAFSIWLINLHNYTELAGQWYHTTRVYSVSEYLTTDPHRYFIMESGPCSIIMWSYICTKYNSGYKVWNSWNIDFHYFWNLGIRFFIVTRKKEEECI